MTTENCIYHSGYNMYTGYQCPIIPLLKNVYSVQEYYKVLNDYCKACPLVTKGNYIDLNVDGDLLGLIEDLKSILEDVLDA